MKAFFVHGQDADWVVIPDIQKVVKADGQVLARFMSSDPWFESWGGEDAQGPPESYGTIMVTRNDEAPVVLADAALWQERQKVLETQMPAPEESQSQSTQQVQEEEWSMDDMDFS